MRVSTANASCADRRQTYGPFTPAIFRRELLRDYLHNYGLYCTKWVHSHLRLSTNYCDYNVINTCANSSRNSSRLKTRRCELSLTMEMS